ncbi:MAG: hypothetical protein DRP47_03185 [Candidatus Zixiibacteriota bacterium]|nr:MAG: hypothetical protein DRP47_03185 [candidate division Zixibacteria bacterium]
MKRYTLLLITILLLLAVLSTTALSIEPKSKGINVSEITKSADSLLNEADATFKSRNYKTALEQYQTALEESQKEFNISVETEALSQMARMNLLLGDPEEGHKWLSKAGERASESDPMGWSRYLGVRGRFEWQDDDLKTARVTFEKMFEYCNANALWGRAVDAAHMIAIVAKNPEDQIEWGRRGIEIAEAADNESWLGPLWNNLAGTYWDIKQYDFALSCYKKAREYHWRFSGEVAKLFADYHIGMTYRFLGQNDEARKWLRPVLAWAERLENHGVIGQACEDLGEADISDGKKDSGLQMLKRAQKEYQLEGYDKTWPEVWDGINKRIAKLEK